MERDLSKIRMKRAERERRPSHPATASPENPPEISTEEGNASLATVQNPMTGVQQLRDQDTVLPDAPAQVNETVPEAAQTSGSAEAGTKNQAIISLEGMPQDSQNAAGLAISMPDNENATAKTDELLAELPQAPGEAKTVDELDFDSMFNSAEMISQDGALDFDMDFSLEGNDSQNILGDTSMEGINFGTSDLVNAVPATSEDLNSLLPGLESYVNATNEPNAGAPAGISATPLGDVPIPADRQNVSTSAHPTAEPALADTDLEDFFNTTAFDMNQANGNGEELQTGDGNFEGFEEFNDDWWKT